MKPASVRAARQALRTTSLTRSRNSSSLPVTCRKHVDCMLGRNFKTSVIFKLKYTAHTLYGSTCKSKLFSDCSNLWINSFATRLVSCQWKMWHYCTCNLRLPYIKKFNTHTNLSQLIKLRLSEFIQGIRLIFLHSTQAHVTDTIAHLADIQKSRTKRL